MVTIKEGFKAGLCEKGSGGAKRRTETDNYWGRQSRGTFLYREGGDRNYLREEGGPRSKLFSRKEFAGTGRSSLYYSSKDRQKDCFRTFFFALIFFFNPGKMSSRLDAAPISRSKLRIARILIKGKGTGKCVF